MYVFKYNRKPEESVLSLQAKENVITSIIRANLSTGMRDTNPHTCEQFTIKLFGSTDAFLLTEENDNIEDVVQRVKWYLDSQADHFFGYYRAMPIEIGIQSFVGVCEAFGLIGLAYALCDCWYSEVDIAPDEEYERCREEGINYYPDIERRYCYLYAAMSYDIDGFEFPTMQEVIENLYMLMKRGPDDPLF